VALIFEYLALIAFMLLIGSLATFGLAILRNAMLPRWLGGWAAVSGLCTVLGIALLPLQEAFYFLAMLGVLAGLLWFLIAGIWLLLRGTGEAPRPSTGPA
jgi:Na+-translocating ferredoxin:NAD+ oxidoreductase RnfA subunit